MLLTEDERGTPDGERWMYWSRLYGVLKVQNKHAEEARTAYKSYGKTIIFGKIVSSADLQNIVMLRRLPGYKSACVAEKTLA